MENIPMQLRTIADRLYGVRLPAYETGAINTLLASASDLNAIAQQMEEKTKAQADAPEKPKA